MEFEEMRKIWDEQSDQPLYVIDEAGLYRRVQQKSRRVNRNADIFEWAMITIVLLTGGFLLFDAIIDQESIYSHLNGIIIMLVSIYIYWGRRQRLQSVSHYDQSMLGELDRALDNVRFQIKRLRTFFWWYILPFLIGNGLNMYDTLHDRPWWVWLLLPAAFGLAWWLVRWEIRCMHLPRQRELEGVKEMILGGE